MKHLRLYGVKVRERVERLVAVVFECGDGERVQVEKFRVRRVNLGENEMFEGDGDGCLGTQPSVGGESDDVLRRERV